MAKKKAARTATRKVKDKWKSKQWYTVKAPGMFNEAVIGETLADEPDKVADRIAEATLQDLTGDFSKMHVKCYFRIRGTRGGDAVTTFDGHDLTSDYVRRLVRRSHSKIEEVVDVTTTDLFQVRLKVMIVTERRAQASQQALIRERVRTVIAESTRVSFLELVRLVLGGDISKAMYDACRIVTPVKRVEIRKSEVIGEPEDAVEVLDVFAPPPEPPEPEPEEEPVEDEAAGEPEAEVVEEEEAEAPEEEAADEAEDDEEADVADDVTKELES